MKRTDNVNYAAIAKYIAATVADSGKTHAVMDLEKMLCHLPKGLRFNSLIPAPNSEDVVVCLMHLTEELSQLDRPLLVSEYLTDCEFLELEGLPYVVTYAPDETDCVILNSFAGAETLQRNALRQLKIALEAYNQKTNPDTIANLMVVYKGTYGNANQDWFATYNLATKKHWLKLSAKTRTAIQGILDWHTFQLRKTLTEDCAEFDIALAPTGDAQEINKEDIEKLGQKLTAKGFKTRELKNVVAAWYKLGTTVLVTKLPEGIETYTLRIE